MVRDYLEKGMFAENSFVLLDEKSGKAAIVDPSFTDSSYDEFESIEYILLTHSHYDHIMSVEEIKKKYGAKVVCHKDEKELLLNPDLNLSSKIGTAITITPDITLEDGESFMLGETKITAFHTPGHTKGSCCYISGKHMFCGDMVMRGTIGREDLPTGNYKVLMQSVEKLKALSDDYILHCGHGENTRLSAEKATNPYFGNIE